MSTYHVPWSIDSYLSCIEDKSTTQRGQSLFDGILERVGHDNGQVKLSIEEGGKNKGHEKLVRTEERRARTCGGDW
jgi:hypothetical protein